MIGAFDFEGNHRARTTMAEKRVVMIITLKRPKRSAKIPGRIRPNILFQTSASILNVNVDLGMDLRGSIQNRKEVT